MTTAIWGGVKMGKKREWIQNRTNIGSSAILNNKTGDKRVPSVVEIIRSKINRVYGEK